jgi:2-polyprenyl-6-methoxyphenol hydroxylase-like FAD-dependent oxidoreductase
VTATVAIVGGGPVGLYLALALLHEGIEPKVFERGDLPRARGSRSIGIHPPSIELFDELGLGESFLARATLVRRGLAFGERGSIGDVSFDRCPGPHRFVATLEQWKTEAWLREALLARAPGALVAPSLVEGVREESDGVTLALTAPDGSTRTSSFTAVVGADGKRSVVRGAIDASFDGATYDGEYAMADGPDTTSFGDDAAVFLTRDGLVESFPLPGRRRRWVVRRDQSSVPPSVEEIVAIALARAHQTLDASTLEAPSAFRAEHRLASRLARGRIALVGDAAHIVSPIGGQGMNLGWIGARSVARVLGRELSRGRDPSAALERDAARRAIEARTATRRAEMNMWLGRPTPRSAARASVVRTLLTLPISHLLARAFTMRALGLGF